MAVQSGYAGSRNRWREVSISSVSFPLSVILPLTKTTTAGCGCVCRADYRAAAVAAVAFLTSPPFVGGQPGAPGPLIPPKTIADGRTSVRRTGEGRRYIIAEL